MTEIWKICILWSATMLEQCTELLKEAQRQLQMVEFCKICILWPPTDLEHCTGVLNGAQRRTK